MPWPLVSSSPDHLPQNSPISMIPRGHYDRMERKKCRPPCVSQRWGSGELGGGRVGDYGRRIAITQKAKSRRKKQLHDFSFKDSDLKLSPKKCPPPWSCKAKYSSIPPLHLTQLTDGVYSSTQAAFSGPPRIVPALPLDGVRAALL